MRVLVSVMAALSVITVGCGKGNISNVDQKTVERHYTVSYDKETRTLLAGAKFTAGRLSVKLDERSRITFDGEAMTNESSWITREIPYGIAKENISLSAAMGPHYFDFKDNDGRAFRDTVHLPKAPALNVEETRVNHSQKIRVAWFTEQPVQHGKVFLRVREAKSGVIPWEKLQGAQEFSADESQRGKNRGDLGLDTGKLAWAGKYLVQACLEETSKVGGGIQFTGTLCSSGVAIEVLK